MNEDLAFWGADEFEEEDDIEVHPDNWVALVTFLKIDHCWHYNKDGLRQRMAWQDASIILDRLNISISEKDFGRVAMLERMLIEV